MYLLELECASTLLNVEHNDLQSREHKASCQSSMEEQTTAHRPITDTPGANELRNRRPDDILARTARRPRVISELAAGESSTLVSALASHMSSLLKIITGTPYRYRRTAYGLHTDRKQANRQTDHGDLLEGI